MPAAAGDGLLGEPAAPGGGGGSEDAARPAAACEGSFLPAWVSGVPRERLRDFQHHKRVGNYLIGSRKLGEGSFAKVREGLHVLTGEKVSRPGRRPLARGWGIEAEALRGPCREHCARSPAASSRLCASPAARLSSPVEGGVQPNARAGPRIQVTGLSQEVVWGSFSPGGCWCIRETAGCPFAPRRAPPGGHQRGVGVGGLAVEAVAGLISREAGTKAGVCGALC